MQYASNRQLLCTFTNSDEFQRIITEVGQFYEICKGKVFVFSNAKNPKEIYLTYNVFDLKKDAIKFPNTILIHRKKQTNTIYTLNGMNRLIEQETGSQNSKYVLNWELYANSLILTNDTSVRIIPLKIMPVIE